MSLDLQEGFAGDLWVTIQSDDIDKLSDEFDAMTDSVKDLRYIFNKVGKMLLERTLNRMDEGVSPDGEPWEPLSDYTIKKYAKDGTVHHGLLHNTGALRDSISFHSYRKRLEFYSEGCAYASSHQFGDVNGMAILPAREFLGLNEEDIVLMLEMLTEYAIKRGFAVESMLPF